MQYVRSIDDLDRLRSLSGTKWVRHGPDVIPAWVADMDLEPAPAIKQAISDMVDRGDLGYQTALRDSLVPAWLHWLDQRHGLRLPESEVWPFAGVLHGLETSMVLHICPDDARMDRVHEIRDKYGLLGPGPDTAPGHQFLASTTFQQKGLRERLLCDVAADNYDLASAEKGAKFAELAIAGTAAYLEAMIENVSIE